MNISQYIDFALSEGAKRIELRVTPKSPLLPVLVDLGFSQDYVKHVGVQEGTPAGNFTSPVEYVVMSMYSERGTE